MSKNDLESSVPNDAFQTKNDSKVRKKPKHPDQLLYRPPSRQKNATSKPISPSKNELASASDSFQQEETNNIADNWESLYIDNAEIADNLNDHFGIDSIKPEMVMRTSSDIDKICDKIYDFRLADHLDETAHILEAYGFDSDLSAQNIVSCLSFDFRNFELVWVDDTHCLIVFPTVAVACEALKKTYPILKLRPLSQATKESKSKAKVAMKSATRKLRPETSALTARRMVIGALGIKVNLDKDRAKIEQEKLRLAKERKKSMKQAKNIWDDDNI
ncbi:Coiled-coil domain-containing protein R3HCC1L [Sarcoptes scabiei]|nr:Coiled-coil domain-containing protein R3HCC1L [Sarcoptes scabiei]UXI20352.1 histone-lysine N-methyltransferase [Sarcoptes scabiei]